MIPFNTTKYRGMSKSSKEISSDMFATLTGPLGKKKLESRISKLALGPREMEYVNNVILKHNKYGRRAITKRTFLRGLEDLADSTDDPMRRIEIERLRRRF